jgi:AGCS family alanine or glycine:cation symporter
MKMEAIIGKILGDLGTFLFGPIMLAVFFGVGLYFTIRLRGIQFTRFRIAFREVVWNVEKKSDEGDTKDFFADYDHALSKGKAE